MLKLMLSGKPSDWVNFPEAEGNPITGQFTLTEKAWVKGALLERKWKVFVPKHKHQWAVKKVGEGKYTVLVECDDLAIATDTVHGYAVRMVDIHDL